MLSYLLLFQLPSSSFPSLLLIFIEYKFQARVNKVSVLPRSFISRLGLTKSMLYLAFSFLGSG